MLIILLISLKVALIEDFLTSTGNLATYEKLLGSGMKWSTSEHDSPKEGNERFNYFKTTLRKFCKPLPILFDDISAPFHSPCTCLIWSRILNLTILHEYLDARSFHPQFPQERPYLYISNQTYHLQMNLQLKPKLINLILNYIHFKINPPLQTV